jgi:CubicO group peptidase (beta-lactamase class C family)
MPVHFPNRLAVKRTTWNTPPMTLGVITDDGIEALRNQMAALTAHEVPGLAWAVACGGRSWEGAAGEADVDSIFRIASLTKPIVAAAVLQAAGAGAFELDAAIDRWLPELADRRVLRDPFGPPDETVPAERPITVRDLLTFTAGYGYDFAHFDRQAHVAELQRLGVGVGPPAPAHRPPPDEWVRRLAQVPLDHQPGAAWRYDFGTDIAGVLLSRAVGQPLPDLLAERIFSPLAMVDTGFHVTAAQRSRMTTAYDIDDDGRRRVFDTPDGQWSSAPAFPSGSGGLVSTVGDMLAFGQAMLAGGSPVLTPSAVAVMTTDHLAPLGLSIAADDDIGWGFGVDVVRPGAADGRSPGSYGWAGGLGSVWWNDPSADLVAVLLTNQALDGPGGARSLETFRRSVWAALDH